VSVPAGTFASVMLKVLMVRHGQSEWNAVGRWQGQADPPLSDLGIRQSEAAGRSAGSFDAIVASDLDRAATTARIMADVIGVGPVITDEGLRERDVGEWQSLTRTEIETAYPGLLDNGRRPPGWETDESVLQRALGSLDRIAGHVISGEVLVVAHGGIIYTLERHLGADFAPIQNLHGRWFHRSESRLELGDRVALVTDTGEAAAL
jgi:broad specificity phosphatase PhoE